VSDAKPVPVRVGTVHFDEATNEWVMPADFAGEEELRWPADSPPGDGPAAGNIPLAEQLAALLEPGRIEAAIDSIIADLSDPAYRAEIAAMCEQGLIEGHAEHGDSICYLSPDEIRHESFCEIRDAVNYRTVGGMAGPR